MNINEMFLAAEAAEDGGDFADLLDHTQLEADTKVLAEIVYSKGEVKPATPGAGPAPRWTNKLKVLEGPNAGGEFFDSIYTSGKTGDGPAGYNKRQFAKLQAAGLGAQFFSTNPSAEAIGKALQGQKVLVTIKWQKPSDDGKVWGEHLWSPASDATPAGGPAGFGSPQY